MLCPPAPCLAVAREALSQMWGDYVPATPVIPVGPVGLEVRADVFPKSPAPADVFSKSPTHTGPGQPLSGHHFRMGWLPGVAEPLICHTQISGQATRHTSGPLDTATSSAQVEEPEPTLPQLGGLPLTSLLFWRRPSVAIGPWKALSTGAPPGHPLREEIRPLQTPEPKLLSPRFGVSFGSCSEQPVVEKSVSAACSGQPAAVCTLSLHLEEVRRAGAHPTAGS